MNEYLNALLQKASGKEVVLPEKGQTTYNRPIEPEGPLDAKVIVLGECPGWEEEEQGLHFVSAGGRKMRNHMRLAGLRPERTRMLYVYPRFPPAGALTHVEASELAQWQKQCLEEVRRCLEARVVVCVGNLALETFTGLKDITRRRGSVYALKGGLKVLGIIPPSTIYRRPEYEKQSRLDWERVKILSTLHETHHQYCGCALRQKRDHITVYSPKGLFSNTIQRYMEMCQDSQKILAIDIETPKVQGKRTMVCASFAFTPNESLVLPWGTELDWAVKFLCESPCTKLGHNFVSFDRWWLERVGIHVQGEVRDTLAVHHCLDPASAHSLEYLTSILTWEPWYKDEGKGHDESAVLSSDEAKEAYYRYCGLDSCVTLEIHNRLWPELERKSLVDFYRKHYEGLYEPMLSLMSEGVHIDHARRKGLLEELLLDARTARDRLGVLNGKPLYTLGTKRDVQVFRALHNGTDPFGEDYPRDLVEKSLTTIAAKTVSNAQLKTLLYDTLGVPEQLKRRASGEETSTADAVALRKIRLENAQRQDVCEVVDLAMEHNKAQKLASFLYPNTFDEDGLFRFTLKLNTEASRLASSKAPDGSGQNSQNIPREAKLKGRPVNIRSIYLPDPGHVILEGDASQIEGRIVFVRTGDPNLIKLGRARTDFDQHAYTASLVFKKPIEEVGKGTDERQVAKSVSHACFDWKTEVLTQDGFKQINMLTQWDTVAQYNKTTEEITFCVPDEYHKYPYEGNLLRFRQGYLAQLVTPDHRMLYETNGKWKVTDAAHVPAKGKIALNGYYSGTVKVTEFFAQLCAALQADGSYIKNGGIRWRFKKERKVLRLTSLLVACGYAYQELRTDDYTDIWIGREVSKDLMYWLPNKQFSSRLLQWNGESLDHLLNELGEWDGTKRGDALQYRTAELANVEWVQIIAHLRGRKASIVERKPSQSAYSQRPCWEVNMSNMRASSAGHPAPYQYQGFVYCLSVPTSFLVIRRNGCVSITGNCQRDMQGPTMADWMLKNGMLHLDGTAYLPEECDVLIEGYHQVFPGIRFWQQKIRREVRAKKQLTNRWGRTWDVHYEEMTSELFRRAYNFLPQSECAEITNQLGFIALWRWLKAQKMRSRILFQEHDALVCSCPVDEVYDVAHFLKESIEVELDYDGVGLSVPMEWGIGKNWGEKKEFKELPERAELEAVAQRCLTA